MRKLLETEQRSYNTKFTLIEIPPRRSLFNFQVYKGPKTRTYRPYDNYETVILDLPMPYILLGIYHGGYTSISYISASHKPLTSMDDQVYELPMPHCSADGYHCSHGTRGNILDGIQLFYEEAYHYFLGAGYTGEGAKKLYAPMRVGGPDAVSGSHITSVEPYEKKWEPLDLDDLVKQDFLTSPAIRIESSNNVAQFLYGTKVEYYFDKEEPISVDSPDQSVKL